MNRVILAGRITKDPELRKSPSGVSFVSFSIAVNRQMPNAQGERVADFINCVAFNKQAENLAHYIRKGGLIGVDGKLQTRTYQGNDGTTRYATDVICDSITFLESRNAGQQPQNQDYSSYENNFNQPVQQVNQNRNSYQQPNNNYQSQNNFNQQNNYASDNSNKEDNFGDVAMKFDVSDDDLPF